MSRFCLDTSAYSQFKRGDPAVVEILDGAEWLGVPAVVIGELWVGFLRGARRQRNWRELREFLDHPVVEEISIDREVARIYGEIHVELLATGTLLPANDLWVAAAAARAGATVLTYDAHFEAIRRAGSLILPPPA